MPLRGGSSSKDVLLDSHKLNLESLSTLKATIDSSSLSEVDKRALMHWTLLSCRAGWGASLKSPEEKRDSQLKEHLDALIAFNRTFCAGDSAPENSDAAMAWLKALDSDPEVVEVMALANSALRDRDEAALSLLGESISTLKSEAAMEKAIYVLAQVERKNGRATWSLGSDYTRGLDGLTIQKLQRNAGLLAACAEFGGCGPNSPRYIFLCEQSQQCRRGESVEQYVLRFTAPGHVPALQRMVADIRAMRPR